MNLITNFVLNMNPITTFIIGVGVGVILTIILFLLLLEDGSLIRGE